MVVFHPRTRTTMPSTQATGNVCEIREVSNTSSPFYPVAFIPILHDPSLLGSCVPPGSYGEPLLMKLKDLTSLFNPLAIVSH